MFWNAVVARSGDLFLGGKLREKTSTIAYIVGASLNGRWSVVKEEPTQELRP